ncbi:MAG: hypothetical protein AB1480_15385 [Nitrospirota bacterium]
MKIPEKLKIWFDVRKKYKLSDVHIQMARELGLNPKKIGKINNPDQEKWKLPLPEFIERIYFRRFGKTRPEKVMSLEQVIRQKELKKKRKQEERQIEIPEEMKKEIDRIVIEKAIASGRNLQFRIKNCFVYLNEDNSPICRLRYLGKKEIWGFAIFKYSTESYSTNEFGFPLRDTLENCIDIALNAYI